MLRCVASRRGWIRRLWEEQPGLHRGYIVDVFTAVLAACALFLGGRARTRAVAWSTLNDNGGPLLWGTVFAAVAVLLIAATFISGQAMMVALWAAALPYALVGWWFFQTAAFEEPSASFFGALLCFRAAFMHLSRGAAYWERRNSYPGGPRGLSSV
jgi:hypothetical protein